MRITKDLDNSPLNESQFSDFPHLDVPHSLHNKPVCFYHPDQSITNFCRSSGCLLPLCPECVKLHATSHRTQGTHGDFDTIDNTVRELFQDLGKQEQSFREDEINFKDFQKLTNEYQGLMMQKIQNARSRVLEIVEGYFSQLAGDVERRVAMQVQRAQTEIQNNLEKLRGRQEQIKEFMTNLKNQRVLKTTIHLMSTPFCAEQQALHREFQSLHNLLHSQKIDVLADDNVLHNINCNLIKYINVHNQDLYKPELSLQAPQKILSSSNIKGQIIRSQSPTILISNVKSPQQQGAGGSIIIQNPPPLNQSRITIKASQLNLQNPMAAGPRPQQESIHLAPQNRAPENLKASGSIQLHRPQNSVQVEPLVLRDPNRTVEQQNQGIQYRSNPKFLVTQSPQPVRVRSVSPTTKMVRVVYNNANASNEKMNQVYLESEARAGVVETTGVRTTNFRKK